MAYIVIFILIALCAYLIYTNQLLSAEIYKLSKLKAYERFAKEVLDYDDDFGDLAVKCGVLEEYDPANCDVPYDYAIIRKDAPHYYKLVGCECDCSEDK